MKDGKALSAGRCDADGGLGRLKAERELEDLFRLDGEDACELLLVRPAAGAEGNAGTWPALSCEGYEQAQRLGWRLESLWIETIYSAPEPVAVETATLLAELSARPLVTLEKLRDIEYRACVQPPQSARCEQSAAASFIANPRWDAVAGFAPSRGFRLRTVETLEEIIASHAGRRAVVVTHSSLINAYLSMLLGIPRDLFFMPDHASISTVRSSGDLYAVRSLNDTVHLQGMPRPARAVAFL